MHTAKIMRHPMIVPLGWSTSQAPARSAYIRPVLGPRSEPDAPKPRLVCRWCKSADGRLRMVWVHEADTGIAEVK